MFGILNVDKPAGMTSRDVVDAVLEVIGPHRAGHAGTLDPLATGVLVVCVGQATRLIEYIQQLPKRYAATFRLGFTSDTDDVEGEVAELSDPPLPAVEQLSAAVARFVGTLRQRPPAYSAVKVRGRRAYALARRGLAVELAPRPVEVFALRLTRYAYPEFDLEIDCGSGTYVRALGRDIAVELGTAAVMSALRRTAVGGFLARDACPLDELATHTLDRYLLPALRAVEHLPRIVLAEEAFRRLADGRVIEHAAVPISAGDCAVVNAAGELAAIVEVVDDRHLKPSKVFGVGGRGG